MASRRSGAAEKVKDGRTGFVVEPNVEALAAAFRALKQDDLTARFGRAAYTRYWKAPLTAGAHARALLTLYRHLSEAARMRQRGMTDIAGAAGRA